MFDTIRNSKFFVLTLIATLTIAAGLSPALEQCNEIAKLTGSNSAANDQCGYSVSISGDTAVVGARLSDDAGSSSGSVYIFQRDQGGGGNWGEVKKLTASDAAELDEFGMSVSISGDTVIVGARLNDDHGNDSGSAYIFQRDQGGPNNWGEVKKLTASDASQGDIFGASVSISGDIIIVGARRNDDFGTNCGSAYIFQRDQGGPDNWGEVRKLIASDAVSGDEFGWSVSISDDSAAVGSLWNASCGSGYIFHRNQGGPDNWGEAKKLTASDAASDDWFGFSISISGKTTLVGAPMDDDNGWSSGSAYLFYTHADWHECFDDGDISDWTILNPKPPYKPVIIELSTEQYVSPPYSLKVDSPHLPGYAGYATGPDVPIDFNHPYTVEFMFRYSGVHWCTFCTFGHVALTIDGPSHPIIYWDSAGWHFLPGTPDFGTYCPKKSWTHFKIEINPPTSSYTIIVNGEVIGTVNYGSFISDQTGFHFGDNEGPNCFDHAYWDDISIYQRLICDSYTISESTGGIVNFILLAGANDASRNYLLLGSFSGTAPGTPLPGGLSLPLNWDSFSDLTFALANSSVFQGFMETLVTYGGATLDTQGPLPPGAAGITLYFAYALSSPWDFVSNPVAIEIVN